MSSRRRNFCFLNLLNLALSPFCDDICPGSSNLFVTQRAEDKSVHSSIRQVADERCEGQDTLRRSPLLRLRVRLLGLLPGCQQNVLRHARSILYFSKDLPCRCGLGNLAQRNDRREVRETVFPETCSRPPASEAIYRNGDFAGTSDGSVDRSALIDSDFSRSHRDRHKPESSQAGLLAMSIVYLYPSSYGPSKWCPRIASREFA